MDLRQLSVFVAVAEERSFSRAAERLHVVQSAVSATVKALEREWGLTLFDRSTHAVALSAEGAALLPAARQALASGEAVGHAVDEVRGGLRGRVRVGIMQATLRPGGVSVAQAIAHFGADHPEVTVEVRQASSEHQAELVRTGELDLAIVGLDTAPGVQLEHLASRPIQFACHPGHPLAGRRGVTLAQIADERFAELPVGWGVRTLNDRAFATAGVSREVAYEINDVATVVDFVAHGVAVALLADVATRPDAPVVFVPLRGSDTRWWFSLCTPRDRALSPAARRFADVVREHVRT